MTATRLSEFALGTGSSVVIDTRIVPAPNGGQTAQAYVHTHLDCPNRTRQVVGTYPTERMARAAIPKVKACRTCRPRK